MTLRPAGPLDFLAIDGALARYRARLGDPEHFAAWQAAFWERFGHDPPCAYLDGDAIALVDGSAGHRVVADAPEALVPGLVARLQADPRVAAISLPPLSGPPPPGFRPAERWEHRFFLQYAPEDAGDPPPGYDVVPWEPECQAEAAALLAATNRGTLDGLYLTWPDLPTPDRCRSLLAHLASGAAGPLAADASLLALRDGTLVGLTLVTIESPAEAFLYEVAVRFRHRGTGLASYLLDRLKAALRSRGFQRVRFLACGTNAAVLALFRPDEVRSERMDAGWVWLRS